MKKSKQEQKTQRKKDSPQNDALKPKSVTQKKITVGPEEFEEDHCMEIRMKPQPLNQPVKNENEKEEN